MSPPRSAASAGRPAQHAIAITAAPIPSVAVAEQLEHAQPRRVSQRAEVLGEQILLPRSLREPERRGVEQASGHAAKYTSVDLDVRIC